MVNDPPTISSKSTIPCYYLLDIFSMSFGHGAGDLLLFLLQLMNSIIGRSICLVIPKLLILGRDTLIQVFLCGMCLDLLDMFSSRAKHPLGRKSLLGSECGNVLNCE